MNSGPATPGGSHREINYFKEAFQSQYNLILLAACAGFALVSRSWLPVILGGGLELMYLSLLPQNPRFQRLIRSRKYGREKRESEERLRKLARRLPDDARRRYRALEALCAQIRDNYAQLSSTSQIFVRQVEERLEGLLQGVLRLLVAAQQHVDYLRAASPEGIEREIHHLEESFASAPQKVQEINQRRVEILRKRLEKYGKISENYQVIQAQCAALEDVLALIRDQSVTLKDPQQVSDQISGLLRDVEQTEETVREVEAMFDPAATGLGLSLAEPMEEPPSSSGGGARRKVKG